MAVTVLISCLAAEKRVVGKKKKKIWHAGSHEMESSWVEQLMELEVSDSFF